MLAGGCKSAPKPKPVPYTLVVKADQNLKDMAVSVDVVGIKASEKEDFERYSVTKYWQPSDPLRRDANKRSFRFGAGGKAEFTLPPTDPVWNDWIKKGGVRYLVVIADLPGVDDDRSRRKIIDLDRNNWDKTIREGKADTLRVLVREANVIVESKEKVR